MGALRVDDIPERLLLGILWWDLRWNQEMADDGDCDESELVMRVSSDVNDQQLIPTALHEILHAMAHAWGFKLTHAQIQPLEMALTQLLDQIAARIHDRYSKSPTTLESDEQEDRDPGIQP